MTITNDESSWPGHPGSSLQKTGQCETFVDKVAEHQSLSCCACCGMQLASAGRVVILSLHQPSAEAFALLDRALLLVNGRCAFCGPPSAAEAHLAAAQLPVPHGEATE